MSEYAEQKALCQYIRLQYPDIEMVFYSDGSGINKSKALAGMTKALKSHRGIPDFILAEPRGFYHGLYLELKKTGEVIYKKDGSLRKNEHLEEQAKVLNLLKKKGYFAEFAIGFEQAKKLVDHYLSL